MSSGSGCSVSLLMASAGGCDESSWQGVHFRATAHSSLINAKRRRDVQRVLEGCNAKRGDTYHHIILPFRHAVLKLPRRKIVTHFSAWIRETPILYTIRLKQFDSMIEQRRLRKPSTGRSRGSARRKSKGTEKMRHILILGFLCLAGCETLTGPFAPRSPARVDNPNLSISEQESRGRDRFAIPDESSRVGPPSGNVYPLGR
jgi:hypothetical protein